ncbi:Rpn family recombination-promoting nuclease/putative transposase [Biostraticola tofi]|nr:Rpn family recombination-promoting nuclease/putative transposase [Biostraticola tofi]
MSQHSLSQHDALFKKFLGDIDIARDFFQIHLPANLKQKCDFSTLSLMPGSFIEDNLRHQCSDMLYMLQTTAGNGYIYCLLEHQSRPEKQMAFRLMRYSIAAMHQHLGQGHSLLPVVIPLLFYHGSTSPYPYSNCWLNGFSDPSLAALVYASDFPLIDITVIPDQEILTHRHVALLELVQKHIRTRDIAEIGHALGDLMRHQSLKPEIFRALMYYIFERGFVSDHGQFLQAITERTNVNQEDMMAIGPTLRECGRQEGLQEGLKEGRQESTRFIAWQLMVNGVEREVIKRSTGLTEKELAQITRP